MNWLKDDRTCRWSVAVGARFIASGKDEEKAQGVGLKAQGKIMDWIPRSRLRHGYGRAGKPENDG